MSAVRSAAFDRIDRFLRNNLDDRDYASYAEALDVLWNPTPEQAAVIEAAKAHIDDSKLFDPKSYLALVAAVATLRELEARS